MVWYGSTVGMGFQILIPIWYIPSASSKYTNRVSTSTYNGTYWYGTGSTGTNEGGVLVRTASVLVRTASVAVFTGTVILYKSGSEYLIWTVIVTFLIALCF